MERFKIVPIKTNKTKIKQCPTAEAGIIPKHPFRSYIVGSSGSGKTNLLINLLSRDVFYKGYFDKIYIISPTASHLDDSYRELKLPEEAFFQPDIEVLKIIRDIQEKQIKEKKLEHSDKVLLVMDDVVSYKQFCNSKVLLQFFIMSRHYNISIFLLSQAYHRVPKSIRLNCSCVVYFRGSQKENQVICEDLCPPGHSNRQFDDLINFATKEQYHFLYIDLNQTIADGRYRRNLDSQLIA